MATFYVDLEMRWHFIRVCPTPPNCLTFVCALLVRTRLGRRGESYIYVQASEAQAVLVLIQKVMFKCGKLYLSVEKVTS